MNHFIQFLTFFRIFIAPIIFLMITFGDLYSWALCLFLLASISDYWDGFLARKYNLESTIGEVLDPIADKILVTFIILALCIELSSVFSVKSANELKTMMDEHYYVRDSSTDNTVIVDTPIEETSVPTPVTAPVAETKKDDNEDEVLKELLEGLDV